MWKVGADVRRFLISIVCLLAVIYVGLIFLPDWMLPPAISQVATPSVRWVTAAPSGSCPNTAPLRYRYTTGVLYGCVNGTWAALTSGGGASGTVTSFSSGNLSPLFTTSVANPTTTPALSFSLSTAAALSHLAGPNSYGASAAAPTYRVLAAQDMPAAYGACAILDTAICSSSVDASGNPNFLATAANNVLPINGGTTNLVMFIAGKYQVLASNVTLTLPTTNNVPQWILATQDTSNANMVAGDFLAMNTAPAYAYTAPTCPSPSPSLSATNPAFWFDLSTNTSKLCTSNAGTYSASAAIVIGVVWVDSTPKVLSVASEPVRLGPYRRYEWFGTGADGTLTITSGTTTIDVFKQYASIIISAGTLTHTVQTTTLGTTGVAAKSQNPILIFGTGTVTANSLGNSTGSAGTGAGSGGGTGGYGGSGGGGGGSGATSAAGGVGGGRTTWLRASVANGGGSAGAATPTAGGAGIAVPVTAPLFPFARDGMAASGGNGAGDGTNAGGHGGAGAGSIWLAAPAIVVDTGGTVSANGAAGTNGVAGNAGGAGGGGGGLAILSGGYVLTSAGTFTASGGGAGSGSGSGQAGGAGGAGLAQANKLW